MRCRHDEIGKVLINLQFNQMDLVNMTTKEIEIRSSSAVGEGSL